MSKRRVAIIFGGRSGEHEVSIVSASCVMKAIDKNKYDVELIGIDRDGRWVPMDPSRLLSTAAQVRELNIGQETKSLLPVPFKTEKPMAAGAANALEPGKKYDVVFPIMHGTNGEDGTIQGFLQLAQVPFVGSGVIGSSVCMDKDVAKRLMRDAGIPVVPFLVFRDFEFLKNPDKVIESSGNKFGYPYFVKPANSGSSVGVYKVKSAREAKDAFSKAFQYDTKILVEQAISARELECSVLGNNETNIQVSTVGEIIPHAEFYSYEAKYLDPEGAALEVPAKDISVLQLESIQTYAKHAFKILECRGMARVDFFLSKETGRIYLNELNTIPGFTPISMYPKLWEASGISYAQLIDKLLDLAIEEHRERQKLKTSI